MSAEVKGVTVIDYDGTLVKGNVHNGCNAALRRGIESERLEHMELGPVIYDANQPIAENRSALLEEMRPNVQFHKGASNILADAMNAGERVAIGSFTSHPDIATELLAEHLQTNLLLAAPDALKANLKVVGGFPSREAGAQYSPDGKMYHVVAALQAHGIGPTAESIKSSTLIDDNVSNIQAAWNHGMSTKWVHSGEVKSNVLPFIFELNGERRRFLAQINHDDKSIDTSGYLPEQLAALGVIVGNPNLEAGDKVKPSKSDDDINAFIERAQISEAKRESIIYAQQEQAARVLDGSWSHNVPPQFPALQNLMLPSPIGGTHVATAKDYTRIDQYTEQYYNAAKVDLAYRIDKPTLPGVEATPTVIENTSSFMKHLGGDQAKLSDLNQQSDALSTSIEQNKANPDFAKTDPDFNKDYAKFCAASHEHVASYHGAQKDYFTNLAANDQDPARQAHWSECARTAGELQIISKQDAINNLAIAYRWEQQKGQAQEKPPVKQEVPAQVEPDDVRSSVKAMQSALRHPQTTATAVPLVPQQTMQQPQKPDLQRRNSSASQITTLG